MQTITIVDLVCYFGHCIKLGSAAVVLVLGERDGLPYGSIAIVRPAATNHQVQFRCSHSANGVVVGGQDLGHLCTKDYVCEVYKVTCKLG